MTLRQMAKYAMHNTVISLLLENLQLWKNKAAFSEAVLNYQDKHQFITNVIKDRARKLAGINAGKRSKKTLLALTALKLAGKLRAFASKTNNEELQASMTFTRSEILYIADNKLGPLAISIYDELVKYKVELVAYEITDERIEEFNKLIGEYKISSSSMQKAKKVKKTLGVRLSTLLVELDSFQDNQMGQLMLDFETTEPDFFQSYQNCLSLVDPKTNPTQFTGVITDAETGTPLNKVMVTVNDTNYLSNAKKDGSYKLPVPKPGEYTLSFELNGYEVTTVSGELKLGKTTEVNVTMKKM